MSHPTLGFVRRRQQNRGAARRRSVRDQQGPPGRLYLGQPIDLLRVAFPCRALRLSNASAISCCPTLMRPIPLRAISPGTRTSPRIWSRTPSCAPCGFGSYRGENAKAWLLTIVRNLFLSSATARSSDRTVSLEAYVRPDCGEPDDPARELWDPDQDTPETALIRSSESRSILSSSSVVGQRMAVSLGVERSNRLVDGAVEVIRAGERLMSEV